MTQIRALKKVEKIALALEYFGQRKAKKHIPRELIMDVRRLAKEGKTSRQIIEALGLDMESACFRRRCKELRIHVGRRN